MGTPTPAEPYRKLFAFGLLLGVAGVSLWPVSFAGWMRYPILIHGHLMIMGLFLSFVSGFLMTALPKMSGGGPAATWETNSALVILGVAAAAALLGAMGPAYLFAGLQFAFLGVFALRRFRARKGALPRGFIFIPAGLAWGGCAALIQAGAHLGITLPPPALNWATVGAQQGFLLNLIVGLGSQLIPFLTHVQNVNPMQQRPAPRGTAWSIAVALNASLIVEVYSPAGWNYLLRALLLVAVAIVFFGVLKPRQKKTFVGGGIRHSVWSLPLAFGLMAFFPAHHLALLHIVFIAGYTILTLMIATRVVLAHGGHSLELEKTSVLIAVSYGLFLAAAVARAFAFLNPAAFVWIGAAGAWYWGVGRRRL